jgi:hypothetical protein
MGSIIFNRSIYFLSIILTLKEIYQSGREYFAFTPFFMDEQEVDTPF